MKINRAYLYELKPNVTQRILCAKNAGTARFAYNWGLNQRIEMYENKGESTNAIAQHKVLNSLKSSQFPWMYEVSKCAPQEALRDLDKAFQNFFRGRKTGKSIGFPKFKRKGDRDSFRLTGTIRVGKKSIQLPRLGMIRLKEETWVKGKILSATVFREADRWFVSLLVEEEVKDPSPVQGDLVGVDVGLSCFAALSTGEKIYAPKPLGKMIQRLRRASKKHARKAKGSKNRKKSALRIARLHRKCRNVRKDFLHKESTKLAKTKSVIAIEDLDVKSMFGSSRWNRQLLDVGWGEFRRMLEYKTKWYGSKLVVAPRYFPSTKSCSHCHHVVEKIHLSIRNWSCPRCDSNHDRDVNAAKNILAVSTGSSPGIYACGDSSSGGTGNRSTSYGSLKQELMSGIFVHKL